MDTIPDREFRIARRYRRESCRSLIWWIVVVAFVLNEADGHFEPHQFALAIGLIAAASLPVAWIDRWRIRADDEGFRRRRVRGWDRWPWSAFESGLVRHGPDAFSFHWPGRRDGPRTLRFGWMDVAERELLYELIRRRWTLPPAPEPPERMEFNAVGVRAQTLGPDGEPAGLDRKHSPNFLVRVGPEGLAYKVGLPPFRRFRPFQVIPWQDVKALRLDRASHDRRDFFGLTIVLSDRAINFSPSLMATPGARHRGLDVPHREALAGLLLRHVPADRVSVFAPYGPPADSEERERRLEAVAGSFEIVPTLIWRLFNVFVPLTLLVVALLVGTRGPERAAFAGMMFWLLIFAPGVWLLRLVEGRHGDLHAYWSEA